MGRNIFIWHEGESILSPCAVFHGRKAWAEQGGVRTQIIFHEWKGWITPMEFYALEFFVSEHRHRGGE